MRRYFPGVYGFFRTRLPDRAEDLAQRTFLACIENGSRFRGEGSVRAYVFGIARRQMLRTLEKDEIVRRGELQQPDHSLPTSPSGAVNQREERVLLLRALRRLSTDDQMLLQLFYWERLCTEEIAAVMELGRSAVKVRLHRARCKLRTTIDEDDVPVALRTQTLRELERWASTPRRED